MGEKKVDKKKKIFKNLAQISSVIDLCQIFEDFCFNDLLGGYAF